EVDMSAELSLETEFPQYTMKDLDDRFDAEGNMISSRQRYFKQGRAEGLAEGKNIGLLEGKHIGLLEGRNIGLAEGQNKGRAEERLNNIKQVLYGKFGDIAPDQLEAVLQYRDEPNLFARIIKADSLGELLRLLEAGEG
ncbi:MAG: hypothetical protein Q4F00_11275, partial [bacterium]|nr:hypothetical protein [bacterium]